MQNVNEWQAIVWRECRTLDGTFNRNTLKIADWCNCECVCVWRTPYFRFPTQNSKRFDDDGDYFDFLIYRRLRRPPFPVGTRATQFSLISQFKFAPCSQWWGTYVLNSSPFNWTFWKQNIEKVFSVQIEHKHTYVHQIFFSFMFARIYHFIVLFAFASGVFVAIAYIHGEGDSLKLHV